jgi:hypothetical protein
MHRVRLAANWLLFCFLLGPLPLYAADGTSPAFEPQSHKADGPLLNGQPREGNSLLEVAPQPSSQLPPVSKTPDGNTPAYKPSQQVAALNRNFHPQAPDDGRRPYIGVELEYTELCYLGMEVHGFEVVTIAPDSPAAKAGLQARKNSTPMGDLATLGSVLAFPLALITVPRMRRSGALGMPGDLIVAVDDHRVRTEQELMRALDPLRAGDTTYVTVIRPVIGGGHQTVRVKMKIDRTLDPPKGSGPP